MGIGSIWETISDEFFYFIKFEWLSDVGEFFQGIFENLGEFSPMGTAYGIAMVVGVYLMRNSIFVMVEDMGTGGKLIWYPLFYAFAFGAGYIAGRKVWD